MSNKAFISFRHSDTVFMQMRYINSSKSHQSGFSYTLQVICQSQKNNMILIFGILTPLSAIFQLYHGNQFQWWKKPEYPERTTDHGEATGKLIQCFHYKFLQGEILELQTERKFDRESEGPQWVQDKPPQPILDLVNFDLLLRGFPSSNIKTLNARLLARDITGCHYT